MKTSKKYFLAGLLLASTAFAGGDTGNGGGGIYVNGKFKTFGEMGVQVATTTDDGRPFDVVTSAIRDELRMILNPTLLQLDAKNVKRLSDGIFLSRPGTPEAVYRKIVVVDPNKFRKIAQDYKKAIKDKSIFKDGQFRLFAVTSGAHTDIYPDYENLDVHQQSLILFHEAVFRMYPKATLVDVLAMDVALNKMLQLAPGQADATEFHRALHRIGFMTYTEVVASFLHRLHRMGPGYFYLTTLGGDWLYAKDPSFQCGDGCVGYRAGSFEQSIMLDERKIAAFSRMHPAFSLLFSGVALIEKGLIFRGNNDKDEIEPTKFIGHPGDWVLIGSPNGNLFAMDWKIVGGQPQCLNPPIDSPTAWSAEPPTWSKTCGEVHRLEAEKKTFGEIMSHYHEKWNAKYENRSL